MRQYEIKTNDAGMRLDRFLKKILPEAGLSLLYKSIRKKNITVNKQKVKQEYILQLGDSVEVFFSDETIEKFQGQGKKRTRGRHPEIVLETPHIVVMEKPLGILSHGSGGPFEPNMVDSLISYLIDKGDYVPRIEKTFTPSICNRLDRNTSGLIIGAKTGVGLREVNLLLRERKVEKHYLTICQGQLRGREEIHSSIEKNEEKNRVFESKEGKEAIGIYQPVDYANGYSLVSVNLITGRTHQIRHQLASIGLPVLGDHKYGSRTKFVLKNSGKVVDHQVLHSYKLVFPKIEGPLGDLSQKTVESQPRGLFKEVWEEIKSGGK